LEVLVKEKDGKTRPVEVALTGHENARDLLNILGVDPGQHRVRADGRTLRDHETVPSFGRIIIDGDLASEDPRLAWNEPARDIQDNLSLTLATHFARSPSRVIGMEIKRDVTPSQLADTLVKRFGGVNPHDVSQMVDDRGRNLVEPRYRDRTFVELGVQPGETLDILGDITQGL